MQIDPYLSPCTKLNSERIKDLNKRSDTLNLIEGKWGIVLDSLSQEKNSEQDNNSTATKNNN